MGKSITCTFQVNVTLSNGTKLLAKQTCYGAMNYKQVKGIIAAEQNYQKEKGVQVVYAEIWPQTAKGRNQLKKDFGIMTPNGRVDHYYVTDTLPFIKKLEKFKLVTA